MSDILISDFVKGILIYLRIMAILFTAPIFSNNALPPISKLFLALVLTYIVFFFVDDINAEVNENFLLLILLGFKEIITGTIMGFMLNFVFYGISYAGTLLGFDMGLSIAEAFDHNTETSSNVIGQILSIAAVIIFFLVNGHHYIITAVASSFQIIPIGFFTINYEVYQLLVNYSAGIFVIAVKIASPIMVSFFLVNIASGIIARVVQGMNVFFVLAPLKIIMGLLLLISVTPIYVYVIKNLLAGYEDNLLNLIRAMGSQ